MGEIRDCLTGEAASEQSSPGFERLRVRCRGGAGEGWKEEENFRMVEDVTRAKDVKDPGEE